MAVRFAALGGLGEIGLNCLLLDDGEHALLVDAGLMFPDDTMHGVDFVIPDFAPLGDVAPRLSALLLTHGHEDHIGAVPFLLKEHPVPVYGTPLTLGLLRRRLEEHAVEATLRPIGRTERFAVGRIGVEAFPVCHSIPDGVGFIFRTPDGILVHTGDFKIDPRPLDGTETALPRLRRLAQEEGIDALLSDSTNVERDGHTLPEAFVGEALSGIFSSAPGRVFVAMFSSNIHRIQEAIRAAADSGRQVALCGRSMAGNVETARELGCMVLPRPDLLVSVEEAETLPPKRVAVLSTGSQGEPHSALMLMALGAHRTIRVRPGDTFVLSSKFIPGNERAISNMINHLFLCGARVVYEKISEIHVSGHASREELKAMIEATRPRHFVPVHGEARHLYLHAELAGSLGVPFPRVILDGQVLRLSAGEIEAGEALPAGRIFVDGKGVGDVEGPVLKDRAHLSRDGIVTVVLAISQATGEILYGPDIVTRGVLTENGSDTIMNGARAAVLAAWEEAGIEARKDTAEIATGIRRALRRFFHRQLDRKPVILPVLLEL